MNIIIVLDALDLENGGVGTCVYDLCEEFLQENNRVLLVGIVNYDFQNDLLVDKLICDGIEVLNVGSKSRRDALIFFPKYILKLKKMLKEWSGNSPTICNVHLKLGVLYGAVASIGLKNIKCVETYHNMYRYYYLQCWALKGIIKKYIAVSNTAQKEMCFRLKVSKKQVVAIPNGINREEIRASITNNVDNQEKNKSLLVVTVGRLSYEKNIITAIKAFLNVKNVDFKYVIIGDGPQKKEAEELVNGNERITLLGKLHRNEVLNFLSKSDLVVMPSLWEGRSILMLEASAFDIPFIISDVPGLREVFVEDKLKKEEKYRRCDFGYLVRTNDEEAYKDAFLDYYSHPELHNNMRKYVREMSLRNDIKYVGSRYLGVFRQVIEDNEEKIK